MVLAFPRSGRTVPRMNPAEDETPLWLPDASGIFYIRQSLMRALAAGSADDSDAEQVAAVNGHPQLGALSSDGKTVLWSVDGDIGMGSRGDGVETRVFLNTPAVERAPTLSPDDRWVASVFQHQVPGKSLSRKVKDKRKIYQENAERIFSS